MAGSGSGVLSSKRFFEVLRDLEADLFEGVALGGRDMPDLSGFDELDVGVFTGELGELGPLRSCWESKGSRDYFTKYAQSLSRGLQ